jgi:hypothetical protein
MDELYLFYPFNPLTIFAVDYGLSTVDDFAFAVDYELDKPLPLSPPLLK